MVWFATFFSNDVWGLNSYETGYDLTNGFYNCALSLSHMHTQTHFSTSSYHTITYQLVLPFFFFLFYLTFSPLGKDESLVRLLRFKTLQFAAVIYEINLLNFVKYTRKKFMCIICLTIS